jgi:hypothetical protein
VGEIPYCMARVIRFAPEDEDDPLPEESTRLDSFPEVERFLKRTYGWFAKVVAERRTLEECPGEAIGGFGVKLTNRWMSMVEVGVGRKVWLLLRIVPRPTLCFSDHPEIDGSLVFYLDGWHHTELESEMLVSREACLRALHDWLETDCFPSAS